MPNIAGQVNRKVGSTPPAGRIGLLCTAERGSFSLARCQACQPSSWRRARILQSRSAEIASCCDPLAIQANTLRLRRQFCIMRDVERGGGPMDLRGRKFGMLRAALKPLQACHVRAMADDLQPFRNAVFKASAGRSIRNQDAAASARVIGAEIRTFRYQVPRSAKV